MDNYIKRLFFIYLVLVIGTYLIGRLALEMFTTNISVTAIWCFAIAMLPLSIYIAMKWAEPKGSRSYSYIGTFLMLYIGFLYSGYFTWMKTDLLLSAAFKPVTVETVPVVSVEKVFIRKVGFDHTAVTIGYKNQNLVLEASRNLFFLLEHKKTMTISIGQSYNGNYFITDLHLPAAERWTARSVYLQDWIHRRWWIAGFILLIVIIVWVRSRFWPKATEEKRQPISWQKLIIFVMGTIFVLAFLAYVGLIIYLKVLAKSGRL